MQQHLLNYENFKLVLQVIIEIVRKPNERAIWAGSSSHHDRPFLFTMPFR
jgi:hypothetical protein